MRCSFWKWLKRRSTLRVTGSPWWSGGMMPTSMRKNCTVGEAASGAYSRRPAPRAAQAYSACLQREMNCNALSDAPAHHDSILVLQLGLCPRGHSNAVAPACIHVCCRQPLNADTLAHCNLHVRSWQSVDIHTSLLLSQSDLWLMVSLCPSQGISSAVQQAVMQNKA